MRTIKIAGPWDKQGKNSGQLTLEYYGADDMERLIEALRGLRV